MMANEDGDVEDNFMVSTADLMACVLLVFVLLAVLFALRAQQQEELAKLREKEASEQRELAAARSQRWERATQERDRILRTIRDDLKRQGIVATISNDGLQFGDEALRFRDCDEAVQKFKDKDPLAAIATALEAGFGQYAYGCARSDRPEALVKENEINVVFIEGHTDSRPAGACDRFTDNWILSAARARWTKDELFKAKPGLRDMCNRGNQRLFSIAGYASDRPVVDDPKASVNRRIEIRVVMRPPD